MDWSQSQIWVAVAAAVGGTGFFTVAVQEFGKWRSGRAAEERTENKDLKSTTELAVEVRDWADDCRRIIADKAAKWRRIAVEHGVPEETLGDWPHLPPKPQPKKDK